MKVYRVGPLAKWYPAINTGPYQLSLEFDKFNEDNFINYDRRIGAIYASPQFSEVGRWIELQHDRKRHWRINGRNYKKRLKEKPKVWELDVDPNKINVYSVNNYENWNYEDYWYSGVKLSGWTPPLGISLNHELLLKSSDIKSVRMVNENEYLKYICPNFAKNTYVKRFYDFTNVIHEPCECYDCKYGDE